jgi:HEAT repeat protein
MGTNANVVVPVLIEQLQDKDSDIAGMAAAFLRWLAIEPKLVVPALTNTLQASEAYVRSRAAQALALYGNQARSALPSLLHAVGDSDRSVRGAATNALRQIAPEVLGEAGRDSRPESPKRAEK